MEINGKDNYGKYHFSFRKYEGVRTLLIRMHIIASKDNKPKFVYFGITLNRKKRYAMIIRENATLIRST
jgi:hypothetical protein